MNILDKNLSIVSAFESFDDLLWNERYRGAGDFKIMLSPYVPEARYIDIGTYIIRDDSERVMIVETFDPDTDVDAGDVVVIGGRSLESILHRRIIWQQTIISGNFQNGIKKLLTENAINPSIESRKIPNLIFVDSTDTNITSITIEDTQFTGDDLYDAIDTLCKEHNVGWKITMNDSNQFEFKLYFGKDRSTNQTVRTQITMSVDNDNLFSSSHSIDTKNFKNVTLVAGEGEGASRKTAVVGEASGLDRYELFTDARDISSDNGETTIPAATYTNMLIERGKQKLAECIVEEKIDAEVDTTERSMFTYKEELPYSSRSSFPLYGKEGKVYLDETTNKAWIWNGNSYELYYKGYYSIGDTINVIDRYGYKSVSRVTEMTICVNEKGIQYRPIFEHEEEVS